MNDGVDLVARYIAGRQSRGVGNSEMRVEQDNIQEDEEEFVFEEDENDEDEDYGLEDHDEEDNGEGEGSHTDAQGRKFRSKAWREFEPIHVDGEVTKGECKHCKAVISARRGHGTSGLRNHLNMCKDRAAVVGALNQMNATLMTPDGVSRLWKWDPDVARKALVRMVVLHEFPLSIVEYDFRSRLTPDTVEALICLQDWFRTSSTTDVSTATTSVYDILGDEGLSIIADVE